MRGESLAGSFNQEKHICEGALLHAHATSRQLNRNNINVWSNQFLPRAIDGLCPARIWKTKKPERGPGIQCTECNPLSFNASDIQQSISCSSVRLLPSSFSS